MPPCDISQSTIDEITELIIAKIKPIIHDTISQAIASTGKSEPTDGAGESTPTVLKAASIPAPDLGTAHWIWTHEAPHHNPPFGLRAFRKVIVIPSGDTVDSMLIDSSFYHVGHLYVNGRMVGPILNKATRWSIKFPLTNRVVIAVCGIKKEDKKAYAGFMASAVMWNSTYYKGEAYCIGTDASWETSITATHAGVGFEKLDYRPDNSWHYARVEGPYGMEPWGAFVKPNTTASVSKGYSYFGLEAFSVPLATPGPPDADLL